MEAAEAPGAEAAEAAVEAAEAAVEAAEAAPMKESRVGRPASFRTPLSSAPGPVDDLMPFSVIRIFKHLPPDGSPKAGLARSSCPRMPCASAARDVAKLLSVKSEVMLLPSADAAFSSTCGAISGRAAPVMPAHASIEERLGANDGEFVSGNSGSPEAAAIAIPGAD
jgi:hypothetical protein